MGVIGKLDVGVEACNPDALSPDGEKINCWEILGAEADFNTTFNFSATAIGVWYHEACDDQTCKDIRIDPIEFQAAASVQVRLAQFLSVTFAVDESVELWEGLSNNECN